MSTTILLYSRITYNQQVTCNNTEHQSKACNSSGKTRTHCMNAKGFFVWLWVFCACDFSCCFSLTYWNISIISFHWFPELHFHQTMLVDCGVVLQQVKTKRGPKIFFRLEGTFPECPSERKIYLDYYLCICLKTVLEAALPSYPAKLFFKNVYFSLAYKYRESLSRLTTLRAQERPPIPEIFKTYQPDF